MPVYVQPPDTPPPATVTERRARIRGYASGIVPVDHVSSELAREAATLGLAVKLSDVTALGHRSPHPRARDAPRPGGTSLRVSLPVAFGGRTWRLDMAPTRPDLLPGETSEGRLLLAGAMVLMFLTGLFVVTEAGLGVAVAAEVTHRTAELNSEVVIRRRLEAMARESEARLDLALRGSTAGAVGSRGRVGPRVPERRLGRHPRPGGPQQQRGADRLAEDRWCTPTTSSASPWRRSPR